ncbi:MAG: hypothetical protein PHX61_09500 [Alphaproteobacteria bacterium]|nr:hypothetical protein [Alphaproteobacteria bacterium]
MKQAFCAVIMFVILTSSSPSWAGTSLPFIVNMSEAVNVDTTGGTPRIALDVGGVTRYASYSAGTGTSSLTFTYDAVAGDVDLDGVTLSSPLDLNGGTITDLNGNPETDLTFTVPNTSGVKIDYPSLSMDFIYDADGRYTLNDTAYNDLPSFLGAVNGTFTRNSVATYFDSTGTLQTALVNQPRFDYDPVTHSPKGILIEERRTNLLTNTQIITAVPTNGTLTFMPSEIGPDGVTGHVYRLQLPASSGTYLSFGNGVGATSTFSIYVRQYGGDKNFSLLLNSSTSGPTKTATSQWIRYSESYISSAGINGINNADDSFATDVLIAFPQLEQGGFATSFIPTTSTVVTREKDIFNIPYIPSLPFGMYGEIEFPSPMNIVPRFIGTNNDGRSPLETSTNGIRTNLWNGTTSLPGPTTSALAGRIVKAASRHTSTGRAVTSDGLVPTSDGGTIPMDWTFISPGHGTGTNTYSNGHVRSIKIYSSATIPDAQLQLLTQ